MNIFKVLANGDGRINEANVSAFLGFLLDPKENHSFGDEFLKRFLDDFIQNGEENFKIEEYEYQIFYEQAFKEKEGSKNIVDIVIVCFKTDSSGKKESLMMDFISNTKKLKKIFLIENKINSGSKNIEQLKNQYNSTVKELGGKIDKEKIEYIYVTPSKNYDKIFKKFQEIKKNSSHIYWSPKENEVEKINIDIKSILEKIIEDENFGKIEAINDYTKHTIKSFIQFIANEFKSEPNIKKGNIKPGEYTDKYKRLNETSNIKNKLENLKDELIKSNPYLNKKNSFVNLNEPRHPCIQIETNDIIVEIYAGYISRDLISIQYRANKNKKETTKKSLNNLAEKLGVPLKKPNSKYDSYCWTDELKNRIPIIDIKKINEKVNKAIELI
jgi:hypothetical protein